MKAKKKRKSLTLKRVKSTLTSIKKNMKKGYRGR